MATSKASMFAWHTIDHWLRAPQSTIAKACHLWTVDRYYSFNRHNTDFKVDETGLGCWRRLLCSFSSEEFGLQSSCGWCFSLQAGHADLWAALAEDRELCAPVHTAARQGRMPVLHIHGKIAVHCPAAPLSLDFWLHLRGETSVGY